MVIPLGLEPGEKQAMNRPPEHPDAPILSRQMIWRMVIVAATMSVMALAVYIFFEKHYGHDYAQTLAFISLVVSQWANAFNARSDSESIISRLKVMNASFYAGIGLSLLLQLLVFFGPLGTILHITPINFWHGALIGLASFVIPIIVSEWHKYFTRKSRV